MPGPAVVSGSSGATPGMPPPLVPPGHDPTLMRQRPSGQPLMPGSGLQNTGSGLQGPPHHPSVRFHQSSAGGYPVPVGSGMIPPHANLLPVSGPPHPMHGNPTMPHHHSSSAMLTHPRPRWVNPSIPQQACGPPCPQQSIGPPVCSGSAGPNPVSSAASGSVGPVSCGGSGVVPSPGHPGTPTQHPPTHLTVPSPINNQVNI